MEYLTAAECSKKWGVSSRMIAYYCETGRIEKAVKKAKAWLIPARAEKPADKRFSRNRIVIPDNRNLQGDLQKINQTDIDNSSIVYHANDLYKNLSLTRETLRYYEEIGLIAPARNRNSQYREFTFSDVSRLMAIDFFKKRGFTPLEIRDLTQTETPPDGLQCLTRKTEELKAEIHARQRMADRLNETEAFCESAKNSKGKFSVKEFPLFSVRESFDAVSDLKEYQTRVLSFLDLQQEDILSGLVRAVTFDSSGYRGTGMCLVKRAMGEDRQAGQTYLESGKSLHVVLEANSRDNSVMENMFFACHKWAKEHRVGLKGTAYIFIRFVTLLRRAERNLYEVWIPLK